MAKNQSNHMCFKEIFQKNYGGLHTIGTTTHHYHTELLNFFKQHNAHFYTSNKNKFV